MDKEKKEKQNVADKYLEEVIYRSWTWKMRIEWLNSIWTAYLTALDYSPRKWQNRNVNP